MSNLIPLWSLGPAFGHRRLDRLIDELWSGAVRPQAQAERVAEFVPRMDVEETADAIRISAELPGLEEKDFEVTLEGDVLVIRGERRGEAEQERKGYSHRERRSGSFRRALRLPFEPAAETLRASYQSGVLAITVPKPEEQARVRAIPVTAA